MTSQTPYRSHKMQKAASPSLFSSQPVMASISPLERGGVVTFVSNGMLTVRRLRRAVRTGELKLIRKGLTALPPKVGQLTLLEALTLEDNQLTALPPEIGKLTKLRTLWLNNNQLTALPPEIGQLTELETLSLDSNQLTALPPEIGKLTELETLSLISNQLTALP